MAARSMTMLVFLRVELQIRQFHNQHACRFKTDLSSRKMFLSTAPISQNYNFTRHVGICFIVRNCPPLWSKWQHARLSRSGPGFDPRSGQVSWVRFFRGFSSPVRQMSGSFRPPRSPNIIWPSLSFILIHYGRQ